MDDERDLLPGLEDGGAPQWRLASPAEVRRRGERRRRGRQACGVAGGLALGLVTALALVVAVLGSDPEEDRLASDPTARVTAVPDDFPLAEGMGAAPVVTAGPDALDAMALCGDGDWGRRVLAGATDVLAATTGPGGPAGGGAQRLLVVFPDEDTAKRAAGDVRREAARCAEGPGADGVHAARVGNAVLLSRVPPGTDRAAVEDRLAEESAPLILHMCVFGEEPCTPGSG